MATLSDIKSNLLLADAALAEALSAVTAAQGAIAQAGQVTDALAAPPPPPPPPPAPTPPSPFSPPTIPLKVGADAWTISSDGTGTVELNGAPTKDPKAGATALWTDGITLYAWAPLGGKMVGWKWLGGVYWGQDYGGVMQAALVAAGIVPPDKTQISGVIVGGTVNPPPPPPPLSSSIPPAAPNGPAPGATVPTTGRAVVLTFNSASVPNGQTATQYVFAESVATDMGDYTDPFGYGVSQHCKRVISPSIQMAVDFRPDTNGQREEVVVRYGMLPASFYPTTAQHVPAVSDITKPYQCDIYVDGVAIASFIVSVHWYWSKWRWSKTAAGAVNVPRPVKTTLPTLVSQGLMFNYKAGFDYDAPAPQEHGFNWPMGDNDALNVNNTGLLRAMSQVGGRGDIGPVTEWQANWMLHGNAASLTTIFAQAEIAGAFPIHWVDDQTGALVDELAYATGQATAGTLDVHMIPIAPGNTDGTTVAALGAGKFSCDTAHFPAVSWLPYILTGDAYYLENLQASATFAIGQTRQFTAGGGDPIHNIKGCVLANQHRTYGWGMRDVFQCRKGSLPAASCPSWLKSREYWQGITDANLTFVGYYMASTALIHTYFHAFVAGADFVIWQSCYISAAMMFAHLFGFTDWDAFRKWQAAGLANFMTGFGDQAGAGWPRNWPNPYYVDCVPNYGTDQPNGTAGYAGPSNPALDAVTYGSYTAMAEDYFSQINGNPGGTNLKAGGATGGTGGFANATIDPYSTWRTTNAGKIEQIVDNLGVDNQLSWLGLMALWATAGDIDDTFGHTNVGPAILAWGRAAMPAFIANLNSGRGSQMRWAIAAPGEVAA